MAMSFQNACYHILAPASEAHEYKKLSKIFDVFLIALIIVNVAAMMLETIPGIPAVWQHELHIIEIVSVLIFSPLSTCFAYTAALRRRIALPANKLRLGKSVGLI